MIRSPLRVCAIVLSSALLMVTAAAAAKKTAPAPRRDPKPCDVYGPGYEPIGDTGVCLKISGYVEFGVGASLRGGHSSAATTSDWIKTRPAKSGN